MSKKCEQRKGRESCKLHTIVDRFPSAVKQREINGVLTRNNRYKRCFDRSTNLLTSKLTYLPLHLHPPPPTTPTGLEIVSNQAWWMSSVELRWYVDVQIIVCTFPSVERAQHMGKAFVLLVITSLRQNQSPADVSTVGKGGENWHLLSSSTHSSWNYVAGEITTCVILWATSRREINSIKFN